jgi:uncharacterized cupredoxin-like copper-binding protein
MKSLKIGIFCSVLVAFPAVAGGGHDHGHEKQKDRGQASSHNSHAKNEGHEHGDGAGPVGSPAQPSSAQSTILVSLTDQMKINFSEDLSSIKSGKVIQFLVTNEGNIPHEFSIGNQAEQKEHAKMMRDMPDMVHSDGNTVTVDPGATKTITWHFEGDDTIVFACNIPGHYEAGMFQNVRLNP